ncbi:hypothetical protein [Synechococcus sp. PROS-U-1]|nr:hypothetical protein [Synechococcus sp. PROS-U-1]QNJ03534.1 hypothetical protein SynPROSU1_01936 [Synechococcus sp. PROS-U-1]
MKERAGDGCMPFDSGDSLGEVLRQRWISGGGPWLVLRSPL